jgi:recombination protein RecT
MAEVKAVAPLRADFMPLNKVENLSQLLDHPDFKNRINLAAAKNVTADRLIRTFALAVQKTPKLAKCSPMSFMGGCITVAWLGLEPNTPLGLVHFIPFDVKKWNPATRTRELVRTDLQVVVGYQGYLDLIYRSEKVLEVHCDVVWAGDEFTYEYGSNRHLHHKPSRSVHAVDEMPQFAYAYAKFDRGGEDFLVMTLADVLAIRARSQGYRAAMYAHDDAISKNKDPHKNPAYSEAPWIKDFVAMMKKTPLRAAQKFWPRSVEMAVASTVDADSMAVDFTKIGDHGDVLDGQFEPIEDDEAPTPAVPAAVSPPEPAEPTREAVVDKPKQTRTARAHKPPSEPLPPPEPIPEAADDTAIVYPLFNWLAEEDDGPFGPSKDPVEFAMDFRQSWNNTLPENRQALVEANNDSLTEAMNRSIEANTIIQPFIIAVKALDEPPPEPALEETYEVARTKNGKGVWDVIAWVNEAKALISKFTTPMDFAHFSKVNGETISKLTVTATTILDNYVTDRKKQLGIEPPHEEEPPEFDDVPPFEEPPQPEKVDPNEAVYLEFKGLFEQTETLSDLGDIARNIAIKTRLSKLQNARPDLAEQLNQLYRKRDAELRARV